MTRSTKQSHRSREMPKKQLRFMVDCGKPRRNAPSIHRSICAPPGPWWIGLRAPSAGSRGPGPHPHMRELGPGPCAPGPHPANVRPGLGRVLHAEPCPAATNQHAVVPGRWEWSHPKHPGRLNTRSKNLFHHFSCKWELFFHLPP